VAALLPADPVIDKAEVRAKAGDREGAAKLYAGWLEANPRAAGAPQAFSRYFELEEDFPSFLATGEKFLASARGLPGAGRSFALIARILELSGRREAARDAYLAAYSEGAGDETLVSAFLLSLEMNDRDALEKSLPQLKAKGSAAGSLLDALASREAGSNQGAQEKLLALAEAAGDPGLHLKTLWVLYAAAQARGDEKSAADLRARLKGKFPGSPEAVIATRATATSRSAVTLAPTPGTFARPAEEAPAANGADTPAAPSSAAPVAPAADPSATPSTTPLPSPDVPPAATTSRLAVQAGSFQMKENADDLVGELTRRGFSPVVRQERVQGKDHYRVLAATGLDAEQAKAAIARLKKLGFSGFALTEK
jgi:cell division septation protein DedD